jgi:hypothetical protein
MLLQPRSPGQIVSPLLKQVAMILSPVVKAAPAMMDPLFVMAQVKYLSGGSWQPSRALCHLTSVRLIRHLIGLLPWGYVCRLPAWDTHACAYARTCACMHALSPDLLFFAVSHTPGTFLTSLTCGWIPPGLLQIAYLIYAGSDHISEYVHTQNRQKMPLGLHSSERNGQTTKYLGLQPEEVTPCRSKAGGVSVKAWWRGKALHRTLFRGCRPEQGPASFSPHQEAQVLERGGKKGVPWVHCYPL